LSQLNAIAKLGTKERFGASFLALAFLAAMFGALFGAAPAHAASPDPSTYAYTIGGTLLNNDKPVAGVTITATEEGGKFKATVKSADDGSWIIMVPDSKVYDINLDTATLPSGVALTSGESNIQKADLTQTDFIAVLFKFGKADTSSVNLGTQILQRLYAGLDFGLMLALAAIGISLIFGTTGLSNFAHGEMVSFGALLVWLFNVALGWNFAIALVLSLSFSALLGYLQDALLWKPLRKRRLGINQMMIVSIGLSIVLRYLLLLFFNGDTKDISGGGQVIMLGPVYASSIGLISMLVSAIALAGVALFLTRTRVGKATRAVSDNASLASATGIDVERIIRLVWVVSGLLTGLAGILYGLQFQANWQVGFELLLLLFAAVTLGGLGTSLGAAVGALIIGMVVELSTLIIPNDMKYASALVILILILIVRPQGVLGKKQRIG
jgi:neutral amino acid transport system permease protein